MVLLPLTSTSRDSEIEVTPEALLFSESNGRLLLEVRTEDAAILETLLATVTLIPLGVVTVGPMLQITDGGQNLIDLSLEQLVNAWKGSAQGVAL